MHLPNPRLNWLVGAGDLPPIAQPQPWSFYSREPRLTSTQPGKRQRQFKDMNSVQEDFNPVFLESKCYIFKAPASVYHSLKPYRLQSQPLLQARCWGGAGCPPLPFLLTTKTVLFGLTPQSDPPARGLSRIQPSCRQPQRERAAAGADLPSLGTVPVAQVTRSTLRSAGG